MTTHNGPHFGPYVPDPAAEANGNGNGAVNNDDPTSLPLFTSSSETRPGRTRGDFTLRPLIPAAPEPEPARRPAFTEGRTSLPATPADATAVDEDDEVEVDRAALSDLREEASRLLDARVAKEGGALSEEDYEALGDEIITDVVRAAVTDKISKGLPNWSASQQKALRKALFQDLFRLGRLQPLLERDDIENITVLFGDTRNATWIEKTDGTLVPGPAIADSREDLRLFLNRLASDANRTFTESRPSLHLKLPGKIHARLAAADWVTGAVTAVVIRRHRIVEVTMAEMVTDKKSCGPVAANFLTAAVSAGKSIVVSGVQGSGKTTWVRALCSVIPPWEAIGTFETEFELFLHELPEQHQIVIPFEHRPGGEGGAGEYTLEKAIHDSFRFNLQRQIVGEVRGPEVWNMLKAMESGPGSISTTHARSATHTIEKLVSCAMETGPQVTRELAVTKLSAAIDIVMHCHVEVVPLGNGAFRKSRWVSEIVVVQPSHDAAKGYTDTSVFKAGPDGHAVATGDLPDDLRAELVRHGFDLEAYKAEAAANRGSLS